MKSVLVKQVLTLLQDMAKNEKEKYETFGETIRKDSERRSAL